MPLSRVDGPSKVIQRSQQPSFSRNPPLDLTMTESVISVHPADACGSFLLRGHLSFGSAVANIPVYFIITEESSKLFQIVGLLPSDGRLLRCVRDSDSRRCVRGCRSLRNTYHIFHHFLSRSFPSARDLTNHTASDDSPFSQSVKVSFLSARDLTNHTASDD